MALGDVDGDGNLDAVIAAGSGTDPNQVCLGDGAGGFGCVDLSADIRFSHDVALGDLDNDGDLDAVFANSLNSAWCLNDGAGVFARTEFAPGIFIEDVAVALGDVNNDRNLDAVFATPFDAPDRRCLGDGTGTLTCADISTANSEDVALGEEGSGGDDVIVGGPLRDIVVGVWRSRHHHRRGR